MDKYDKADPDDEMDGTRDLRTGAKEPPGGSNDSAWSIIFNMKGFASFILAVLLAVGVGVGPLAATGTPTSRRSALALEGESSIPTGSMAITAVSFAQQVLAEAPVPARSRPTSSVPALLDEAMQRPGIPGLLDLHRIYVSPDSPEVVEADVLVRLPKSAKKITAGTFGGPGGSERGFVVFLPTSGPHEYLAQLVYSMVANRSGSTVRVDAQSVWVPDRTANETIPDGAMATLTGYAALSLARGSSGQATVHLDASESARLAGALNRLAVAPRPNCMEDAVLYTIDFQALGSFQYKVVGDECAATVEISVDGQRLAPLHDVGCSVSRLVSEYVPHRATGTRWATSQCRTDA